MPPATGARHDIGHCLQHPPRPVARTADLMVNAVETMADPLV
jgi:hypothetical protein